MNPSTLQIIGSKQFGGAERWFQRFTAAIAAKGTPVQLAVRAGHQLDGDLWGGLPHHALPMRTVWDPLSRFEVNRLIRHLQPQIVQSYMGRATRLTRLKRGAGPLHLARLGGYYKLDGYRHAHAWVCNTRGLCDYLVQHGFPAQRVYHIYNFLDLPPPGPAPAGLRARLGIPEDAWLLMSPGRMVPVKGQRYLLDALAQLPAAIGGRPLWLLLLGDGPLKGELQQQARQSGIDSRIVWAGWQSDPDPYYRLADRVVFPSLDAETFGNVVVEAWAYCKPLLCSAFRGAREIVHDGEDALRVACGDAAAMADGIRELLLDESLAQQLAAAGEQRVSHDFAPEPIIEQYQQLYRELAGV